MPIGGARLACAEAAARVRAEGPRGAGVAPPPNAGPPAMPRDPPYLPRGRRLKATGVLAPVPPQLEVEVVARGAPVVPLAGLAATVAAGPAPVAATGAVEATITAPGPRRPRVVVRVAGAMGRPAAQAPRPARADAHPRLEAGGAVVAPGPRGVASATARRAGAGVVGQVVEGGRVRPDTGAVVAFAMPPLLAPGEAAIASRAAVAAFGAPAAARAGREATPAGHVALGELRPPLQIAGSFASPTRTAAPASAAPSSPVAAVPVVPQASARAVGAPIGARRAAALRSLAAQLAAEAPLPEARRGSRVAHL